MNKWVYVAVGLHCQVVSLLFMGQRPTGTILEGPPVGDKRLNQL